MKLYPACLPLKQRTPVGYHSGWSSPIPLNVLEKHANGYTNVYKDFFKQIHYKMEVLDRCKDADQLPQQFYEYEAQYKTNTYYPPGNLDI